MDPVFANGVWAWKKGKGLTWQKRHFCIHEHTHHLIYCKTLDPNSLEGGMLDMNEASMRSSRQLLSLSYSSIIIANRLKNTVHNGDPERQDCHPVRGKGAAEVSDQVLL